VTPRVLALVFALLLAGCSTGTPAAGSPQFDRAVQLNRAVQVGRAFLDRYEDPDGRVVRRDQGGDTVSEGQAYGMLIAVGVRDQVRFDRAWTWSRRHLAELERGKPAPPSVARRLADP